MAAHHETATLAQRIGIPFEAAHTLRRAQMTLHRWAELECGMDVAREPLTDMNYSSRGIACCA